MNPRAAQARIPDDVARYARWPSVDLRTASTGQSL